MTNSIWNQLKRSLNNVMYVQRAIIMLLLKKGFIEDETADALLQMIPPDRPKEREEMSSKRKVQK